MGRTVHEWRFITVQALFHGEWSVNVLPVNIKVSFTRRAIIGSVVVLPVQIRLHLVQGPFVYACLLCLLSFGRQVIADAR